MAERQIPARIASLAADTAKKVASRAAKKTKSVSRIAKLNVEIAAERDSIKRSYTEIGKLYFETHRDDPESYFYQLCQEIELSLESIAKMEAEILSLKSDSFTPAETAGTEDGPEIEVEITEEPETPADADRAD